MRRRRSLIALGLGAIAICAYALLGAAPAQAISPKDAAQQLFAITNLDRTSNGLRALVRDNRLSTVGVSRSEDMIARDYFSHEIPPKGTTVVDVLESLGVPFVAAGENIAWNNALDFATVQTAGTDFINSPGHRQNLLDDRWDRMGTGVAEGRGKKMYTVVFMQLTPPGPSTGATRPASGPTTGAPAAQRVHGERVDLGASRAGLLTSLVSSLVRLFLSL